MEAELDLPDVNQYLVETALKGAVLHVKEYGDIFDEAGTNSKIALQHHLLDIFPAILNTQIRDLFTPAGRKNGRFRLQQLVAVYETLMHLLCAIALADLWESKVKGGFNISASCLSHIKAYTRYGGQGTDETADLLTAVYQTFEENKQAPFTIELLQLSREIHDSEKLLTAYTYFAKEFCSAVETNIIADDEVQEYCVAAEKQLGVLLEASAFLVNYEVVRIKDIKVDKPVRRALTAFVHDKRMIAGREFPAIDHLPMEYQSSFDNQSIFLTRNATENGLVLNLSPFVIDQNVFKGKKSYLPKVYFYAGKDDKEQLHFKHVDTLDLDFIMSNLASEHAVFYDQRIDNAVQDFEEDIFETK